MKVLLIDDHALFREGLCYILEGLAEDVEVIEAGSFEEAVTVASGEKELDLILLDLSLPGTGGLKAIEEVQRLWVKVPLVIVSGTASDWDIIQCLKRGVCGIIPKTLSSEEMFDGLATVFEGKRFLPKSMARLLHRIDNDASLPRLTNRQRQILELLAQGLTNKHIANKLNIAENTVRIHLAAIYQSLRVTSRTEAVFAAQKDGLISRQQ